jgi:hypothetical protein
MNLLSRLGIILIRILIFFPAFISLECLDDILSRLGLAWRQPSFFWYLYGVQGIWGILCLMPYPDFLFRKKVKVFFLLLILICIANLLWRAWLPSYYASSQLKNYPEYVKSFNEAKQYPKNDGYYNSQDENGITLWLVQRPDFYERDVIIFWSVCFFAPIALFLIRDYQARRGFTWKGFLDLSSSEKS